LGVRTTVVKEDSQETLIKLVRNTWTFRRLRTDLTKVKVAMLQQERPDIIFVNCPGRDLETSYAMQFGTIDWGSNKFL
jgi:hypothetical protein